jgi:hypothetical protein
MIIAVVGANLSSRPSPEALAKAEAVGVAIARGGHALICGGQGGVMEAACRGAANAGGTTIGVLPGAGRDGMNPYVQIPIATGMGDARNAIIVLSADAVIAVAGAYGTLGEIALALNNGKPVAGISTWEIGRNGNVEEAIYRTEDPAEAVRWVVQAAVPQAPPSTTTEVRDG